MNSMWETVMRQRAWLGCRSAAVAWLVFGVLVAGPLAWTNVGMPGAALAQEAKEDGAAGEADLIDDAAPPAEPAKEPAVEPAKDAGAEPREPAAKEPGRRKRTSRSRRSQRPCCRSPCELSAGSIR